MITIESDGLPWISVKDAWPPIGVTVLTKSNVLEHDFPMTYMGRYDRRPWFTHWLPLDWLEDK